MHNFLKRTALGIEAKIRFYSKRGDPLEYAIIPCIPIATSKFHKHIRDELNLCDVVICAGKKKPKARLFFRLIILLIRVGLKRPGLKLDLQSRGQAIDGVRDRLVRTDPDPEELQTRSQIKAWIKTLFQSTVLPLFFFIALPFVNKRFMAEVLIPEEESETEHDMDDIHVENSVVEKTLIKHIEETNKEYEGTRTRIGIFVSEEEIESAAKTLREKLGFHTAYAHRFYAIDF